MGQELQPSPQGPTAPGTAKVRPCPPRAGGGTHEALTVMCKQVTPLQTLQQWTQHKFLPRRKPEGPHASSKRSVPLLPSAILEKQREKGNYPNSLL